MEKKLKFVMTQAVCPEGLALLDGIADIYVADDQDPNNYLDQMQDADALIVRIAKCDGNAILHSPNLKVIGRTGVGYDSVDVKKATELGIPVVITPGANNHSVAEHAMGMMFAIAKNFVEGQAETAKGNFSQVRGNKKAFELLGKKAGFIGLGAIGRDAMKLCQAIGMKTAGYDPFLTKEQVEDMGSEFYTDYEAMMEECDVISVHVPLTAETRNMIGEKQLKRMKPTAILINCARGGIINEADLVNALNEGVIAGAGVDVFEEEPPMPGNPLLAAKNILYSPHSAAQTREAVINMAQMCVNGCLAVCRGEKWPYVADPAVYEHEKWKNR